MCKYSETLMEHVLSPRNGGVMENPDLTGHAGRLGGVLSDSVSQGCGRSNRGVEVSHGWLRANDRVSGRCCRSWSWDGRSTIAAS